MARSTSQGGPGIITDSLIFYYDAANPKSYTGTSATWTDLTIGNRTNTLFNSPTYTTTYGGGFTFSTASLQYFSIPAVSLTTESFAVDIWFKAGSPVFTGNGYNGILSCADLYSSPSQAKRGWGVGMPGFNSGSAYGLSLTSSAGPDIKAASGPTLTVGQVYHFFLQRNTTLQRFELYVNGAYYNSTATIDNTGSINSTSAIGTQTWQYGSLYNNNTYYAIKMYTNKIFTATEISQNYSALKARFGF
jgi:hypothetical protein